jgi:hypothetical protein
MRTTLLIAALVAVTACEGQPQTPPHMLRADYNQPSLDRLKRECDYQRQPFEVAWSCIRVGYDYPTEDADVKALYLATGDYIAAQVTEGKMTQADARYAEAQAAYKAQETVTQRIQAERAADAQARQADAQRRAILGAAIIASRPQPQPVRQPITCTRFGNQVTCQ